MGESKTTRDHGTIRRWTEERGGKPSVVKDTKNEGSGIGLLRIDFPDYSGGDTLEAITWDQFFDTLDEKQLEFLYQDETRDGHMSRFFRFVTGGH
jgi:hypothetical protein